jgi:hypothetical protein
MHNLLLAACLFSFSVSAMASCDELKARIDAQLQAKGVQSYSLDIVPATQAAEEPANAPDAASGVAAMPAEKPAGKVIGNCEGETKLLVYTRN